MVSAVDLIEELRSKGGLLNILKEYYSKLEELAKRATEIWRRAFPRSKVTIGVHDVGRFYGLFRGIYARARSERKRELEPLLREYESIYREYHRLTEGIDLSAIERLISEGERVYRFPKANYRLFLYNLHNWIARVYLYFMVRKRTIEPKIPDIYKFIDKMVHVLIDVTTEYTGERGEGSFEFILSCFIHIENFVHESSEYYEPYGIVPVAIAYLLDILERLVDEYEYLAVYPPYHIGSWEDEYYISPEVPAGTEAEKDVKKTVLEMASQLGIDVKDDIAILEYLEQRFPAYFLIYDHLRGRERRTATAKLPWDFLKLPIGEIVAMFK